MEFFYIDYYKEDKITAFWLVEYSAIILSKQFSAINAFGIWIWQTSKHFARAIEDVLA